VEIKRMNVDELTDDDHAHMRKVVGYVRRHLAQRPDGDGTISRSTTVGWPASLPVAG
jgi:hypothetical protein